MRGRSPEASDTADHTLFPQQGSGFSFTWGAVHYAGAETKSAEDPSRSCPEPRAGAGRGSLPGPREALSGDSVLK